MRGTTWAGNAWAAACPVGALWVGSDAGAPQAWAASAPPLPSGQGSGYAGSVSCRACHEKFYQLWPTSRHGLAMQPYTGEFAQKNLTPQANAITIGKATYRVDLAGDTGWITEKTPQGEKRYPIVHALGGKNVYYFLTLLPKGRLQTLPLAYDVNKKEWFDTAQSGMRHVPDATGGTPVPWRDPAYTFNTSCYSCHVSQLTQHYDLKKDTYQTTWAEPGINCETCHGPSAEHNRAAQASPEAMRTDPKLIRQKTLTAEQVNAACSVCHAKMTPLTATFAPGDRFFDHFDLVTLENPDFYPDGRDLGENYTYTSWRMSPCAAAGELHCVSCHTSSGRYKFRTAQDPNAVCMSCHQERVENAPAHTHHKAGSPGNRCVACHMPKTTFARMTRSDHSMRPPTPAATLAYQSPNACTGCHTDKDAAWADQIVRTWHPRDYQAPVLKRAALIAAARKRDWRTLPAMLAYITSQDRDEVFATSLIRMLPASGDPKVGPVLLQALKDPSPLVRGAAAEGLQDAQTREAFQALVAATGDDFRLVRVRAAQALLGYGKFAPPDADKPRIAAALQEYLTGILARPDQWASHYNLGNVYLNRGELRQAVAAYDMARRLEPAAVPALVNEAMAYARLGEPQQADALLQQARKAAPNSAVVHFNLGLLKAEQQDPKAAEKYLKAALKADPQMAPAAYNLCVLTASDRITEAVQYCKRAAALRPQEAKFAYTLAFYQLQKGDQNDAISTLETLIKQQPTYADAYLLLGETYEKQGKPAAAAHLYAQALRTAGLSDQAKARITAQQEALKRRQ